MRKLCWAKFKARRRRARDECVRWLGVSLACFLIQVMGMTFLGSGFPYWPYLRGMDALMRFVPDTWKVQGNILLGLGILFAVAWFYSMALVGAMAVLIRMRRHLRSAGAAYQVTTER